jgi:hypothetical protein
MKSCITIITKLIEHYATATSLKRAEISGYRELNIRELFLLAQYQMKENSRAFA